MICKYCGTLIPEGSAFCPNCGKPVSADKNVVDDVIDQANSAFRQAEKQIDDAIVDVENTFRGGYQQGGTLPVMRVLQDNRSLLAYILLSIITCGIYPYYFIYRMAEDVNIACEGDGQETPGLAAFLLLSIITCGFYALYWEYNLANRLAANAPRYGLQFQEDGTNILLWYLLGAFVCMIGPYVAMYILIKNTNEICRAYNRGMRA